MPNAALIACAEVIHETRRREISSPTLTALARLRLRSCVGSKEKGAGRQGNIAIYAFVEYGAAGGEKERRLTEMSTPVRPSCCSSTETACSPAVVGGRTAARSNPNAVERPLEHVKTSKHE